MADFNQSFSEFAESAAAAGEIHKLLQVGDSKDVLNYTVFLNGPYAEISHFGPETYSYPDVLLHAKTEQLGLDPNNPRDNLTVAEIIATREAWQYMVLEQSSKTKNGQVIPLPEKVVKDYELLSDKLTHPWILEKIEKQKELSKGLGIALKEASDVTGKPVKDNTPGQHNSGTIISQNKDYTVQSSNKGEIITHENRRLDALPKVGDDVMVSYYRGHGQVAAAKDKLISAPFVERNTQDIAVKLTDHSGQVKQVLLFNGLSSYAKFVEAEKLDKSFVLKAIEAREISPKKITKDMVVIPKLQPLAAQFNNLMITYPAFENKPELLGSLMNSMDKQLSTAEKTKTQSKER
ncbi:MAG TPA: hypothetical protein VGN64_12265 [Dyadobacter sp.]|nr:hypothetical protein [Dyadobacter sp.]